MVRLPHSVDPHTSHRHLYKHPAPAASHHLTDKAPVSPWPPLLPPPHCTGNPPSRDRPLHAGHPSSEPPSRPQSPGVATRSEPARSGTPRPAPRRSSWPPRRRSWAGIASWCRRPQWRPLRPLSRPRRLQRPPQDCRPPGWNGTRRGEWSMVMVTDEISDGIRWFITTAESLWNDSQMKVKTVYATGVFLRTGRSS